MLALLQVTFILNYVAFIVVLWLGLYLILHNPRYPISWLTALTLWSLGTLFLHYFLEIDFLHITELEINTKHWFQGLTVAPALAFWHHATMLMRPRRLNAWRWTRILGAYLLAAAAIVMQSSSQIWYSPPGGNMLYLNSRVAGPFYPIFAAAFLLFVIASMINLIRSARATLAILPRKQLITLAWATLFAGLSIPAMVTGTLAGLPVPTAVITILLVITVGLFGYGVARYSALVEGRTIHRDFFYNLSMVGLICAVYIPACLLLVRTYQIPASILVLIPILAVITHSLINPAYRLLDRLLLSRETRKMRSDLQRLSRLAFEGDALSENLERALHTLCRSVRAIWGILLTFEGNSIRRITDCQAPDSPLDFSVELLKSDDVTHLKQGQLPKPLEEAALLLPLFHENDQFGALVFGHPENGPRYADEDVESILHPAEIIGETILSNQLRYSMMEQVAQLAKTPLPAEKSPLSVEIIENSLRNLSNYAYLADTALSGLAAVQYRLPRGAVTHLERGKVVHDVFLEILDKFKPGTAFSGDPPPREWYPYLVLKEAYVDGISNRDIMMHLYISEGTFNRTRRAAIRSFARALQEMEDSPRSLPG